jgi:hypothetical protein
MKGIAKTYNNQAKAQLHLDLGNKVKQTRRLRVYDLLTKIVLCKFTAALYNRSDI